jgi:hypothetical protein
MKESFHPPLGNSARKCQGKKNSHGLATPGCYVAQSAGEAAMADQPGGVPITSEMYAFKAEIGGDEKLVAGGNPQHGAIIANAGDHCSLAPAKWPCLASFAR